MNDFKFFEEWIARPRKYDLAWSIQYMKKYFADLPGSENIRIESGDESHTIAYVSPCMRPPAQGRLEEWASGRGLLFSDSFLEFHKNWDGGVVPCLHFYRLFSAEEIKGDTERRYLNVAQPPIVRFCDADNGDHFAFMLHDGKYEKVVFADREIPDDELADDEYVTDDSFVNWLKRIFDTDGWPIVQTWDDECLNWRL